MYYIIFAALPFHQALSVDKVEIDPTVRQWMTSKRFELLPVPVDDFRHELANGNVGVVAYRVKCCAQRESHTEARDKNASYPATMKAKTFFRQQGIGSVVDVRHQFRALKACLVKIALSP